MLLCIAIVGGLRLMMGQHTRSESLFYYFRLDDQVPENHLLRLVDKHIDFGFVRERLKDSYSEAGRPSIDPEFLLRILLIGYLYGTSSERKLVEELRMHLAGAGSQVSGSMRKFRITPRFRRIVTGDSRNRRCSSSCSRKLWPNASQLGWCAETSYRSMELSLRQTLPRRAAFRESS
jgi:Transposase domain (DUF772)